MLLRVIRYLSLDIAAGAALLTVVIARYLEVAMPVAVLVCLFAAVWLIYTLDHLIDAKKSTHKELSIPRHVFHRKNFAILTVVWGAVFLGSLYFVLTIPAVTFLYGVILAVAVSVYFGIIRWFKRFPWKEPLVALLYACGVFLGPLSLHSGSVEPAVAFLFIQLFLLALVNLFLFSYYEYSLDQADHHPSVVCHLGLSRSEKWIRYLFTTLFAVQMYGLWENYSSAEGLKLQLIFVAMGIVLLLLYIRPQYFRPEERYRLLGDGIFFLPALWLL